MLPFRGLRPGKRRHRDLRRHGVRRERGRSGFTDCDPVEDRRGGEGRDERHDHQHREQGRRDHPKVEADIKHNQFDKAARVHQGSEGRRVTPREARKARGDRTPSELANACHENDKTAQQPLFGAADELDLRTHSAEREKRRQEKHDN